MKTTGNMPTLTRRGLVLSGLAAGVVVPGRRLFAAPERQTLGRAATWSYQLQGDVSGLMRVNSDLAVVD